jgi:hypothetical protein
MALVFTTRLIPEQDERKRGLIDVFGRHGLVLEVEDAGYPDMSLDMILMITASILIVGPLRAFLDGLAAEAGKDAYKKLRTLLNDVQSDVPPKTKRYRELIRVTDPTVHASVLLSDDLTDRALQDLFNVDLSHFAGDHKNVLAWDRATEQWQLQAYPAKRTDVFGWYNGPPMPPYDWPLWHLTWEPNSRIIVTLCKQPLDDPPFLPSLSGAQCQRCMVVVTFHGGPAPEWWDAERADYKHRPSA